MRNASRALSVLECHLCFRWRYWKESAEKNISAMARRNISPKNTLPDPLVGFRYCQEIGLLRNVPSKLFLGTGASAPS